MHWQTRNELFKTIPWIILSTRKERRTEKKTSSPRNEWQNIYTNKDRSRKQRNIKQINKQEKQILIEPQDTWTNTQRSAFCTQPCTHRIIPLAESAMYTVQCARHDKFIYTIYVIVSYILRYHSTEFCGSLVHASSSDHTVIEAYHRKKNKLKIMK